MSLGFRGLLATLDVSPVEVLPEGKHLLRIPATAVEGFVVLLLYSLGSLAFEAAGPGSGEELAPAEVLQGLSFTGGTLRLWLGEVRGRAVSLEVVLNGEGRVWVAAGDRQDLVPGWIQVLCGRRVAAAYE